MVSKVQPKKAIIEVLKKHPEGLTLQKIAKLTGMNRLTATKYVHELIGEGRIYQRGVGMAKLCYLKERFVQLVKQEEVIEKLRKKLK
ncbi:MAG: helix-turn-helix domain-containing protein [Candidatus Aenigmarchaeota archaeon]|nr:helix-turn-helix domain-containing protein [Candidatus Aenigmarchaeota archaeon]